jgi:hypothetical protein
VKGGKDFETLFLDLIRHQRLLISLSLPVAAIVILKKVMNEDYFPLEHNVAMQASEIGMGQSPRILSPSHGS